MNPRLSVVIVTHNRAALLRKALVGLELQDLGAGEFEVLVVDNASTDDTVAVVQQAAAHRSNIAYLREPTLGANVARNTGWRAARGAYVAFLDDDAIPAVDWCGRIIADFDTLQPTPACLGGRIEPLFEVEPPAWVRGSLLDFLTVIDHSPTPKYLEDILHRQKLASANMAFQRTALERVGGFLPSLDRVGDNLLSGGDVLPQLQLEAIGLPVYYDPLIRVKHHVSRNRLTPEWFRNRAYWGGVSDALLGVHHRGGGLVTALRMLVWAVRTTVLSPRMWLEALTGDDVEARCRLSHKVGCIRGGARALTEALAQRL